jgi:hypothetical protein
MHVVMVCIFYCISSLFHRNYFLYKVRFKKLISFFTTIFIFFSPLCVYFFSPLYIFSFHHYIYFIFTTIFISFSPLYLFLFSLLYLFLLFFTVFLAYFTEIIFCIKFGSRNFLPAGPIQVMVACKIQNCII